MRVLILDESRMGDVLMSTPAYIEILKHFPNAELLTMPCSAEIGKRFFKTVHTSWKTIGKIDMAITFHIIRNSNIKMFLRRIPIRIGYWYKRKLSLNIAKYCLNIRVETDGQMFGNRYRVDEVCELLEKAFGWKCDRKMVFKQ
jgi:ADP-heptose:LPS heptosyltransferase